MTTLWVDVGDMFDYAGLFRRPSGIQRVVFELGRALFERAPAHVGFVRRDAQGSFVAIAWPEISALFAGLTDATPARPAAPRAASFAGQAMQMQIEAWRALLAIPASFRGPARQRAVQAETLAQAAIQPGDTLLVAGAGWSDPGLAAAASAARRCGVRMALLVHDIIPLRRPEWFDPTYVQRFRLWFEAMLGVCDRVLAVSASTAGDVTAYRAELGLAGHPVGVIRLGDGFAAAPGPAGEALPPTPYVLFVSTIELRKNHALLVDVWRNLLAQPPRNALPRDHLPRDQVPHLVFAGREGALTGDLMRQLRATDCLDGRVILRHAATDADIAALYRGCSFTVFPSLYEGWGLPVAESLAFGRPCLAADSTSVPEVGGRLARYFDPLDLGAATEAVLTLLRDPAGLAAWQAEIASAFRPALWSRTAEMVLEHIA